MITIEDVLTCYLLGDNHKSMEFIFSEDILFKYNIKKLLEKNNGLVLEIVEIPIGLLSVSKSTLDIKDYGEDKGKDKYRYRTERLQFRAKVAVPENDDLVPGIVYIDPYVQIVSDSKPNIKKDKDGTWDNCVIRINYKCSCRFELVKDIG